MRLLTSTPPTTPARTTSTHFFAVMGQKLCFLILSRLTCLLHFMASTPTGCVLYMQTILSVPGCCPPRPYFFYNFTQGMMKSCLPPPFFLTSSLMYETMALVFKTKLLLSPSSLNGRNNGKRYCYYFKPAHKRRNKAEETASQRRHGLNIRVFQRPRRETRKEIP